jgi:hypothetical protein
VLTHVECVSQVLSPVAHSLISIGRGEGEREERGGEGERPAQLYPPPEYPLLQVHVKLPGVLVQVANVLQLDAPVTHSLVSLKIC